MPSSPVGPLVVPFPYTEEHHDDQPNPSNKKQPPSGEVRGISEVTQVAVDGMTIYGIYKATHPPKPKPPESK